MSCPHCESLSMYWHAALDPPRYPRRFTRLADTPRRGSLPVYPDGFLLLGDRIPEHCPPIDRPIPATQLPCTPPVEPGIYCPELAEIHTRTFAALGRLRRCGDFGGEAATNAYAFTSWYWQQDVLGSLEGTPQQWANRIASRIQAQAIEVPESTLREALLRVADTVRRRRPCWHVEEVGQSWRKALMCRELGSTAAFHCGQCHLCGTPLRIDDEGQEWCDRCDKHQLYRSHGFSGEDLDDEANLCPELGALES